MMGFKQLIQKIWENSEIAVQQNAAIIRQQKAQLDLIGQQIDILQKILAALQAQPVVKPVVALRFKFGTPVAK